MLSRRVRRGRRVLIFSPLCPLRTSRETTLTQQKLSKNHIKKAPPEGEAHKPDVRFLHHKSLVLLHRLNLYKLIPRKRNTFRASAKKLFIL